jgi:excisionase family DNA binding protein
MLNDLNDYLTPQQAGEILNVTAEAVRALLRRGVLDGQKLGRDWFITRSDLEAYQGRRRSPGRPVKK